VLDGDSCFQASWKPYWDLFAAISLLYSSVVRPFEAGFLAGTVIRVDLVFVLNRIADTVFVTVSGVVAVCARLQHDQRTLTRQQ
jgi:ABC-type transport system involved in multi-copper enzyme maturation permease subunit